MTENAARSPRQVKGRQASVAHLRGIDAAEPAASARKRMAVAVARQASHRRLDRAMPDHLQHRLRLDSHLALRPPVAGIRHPAAALARRIRLGHRRSWGATCSPACILYGARVSLFVGVVTVTISMVLGVAMGVLAGYYGGWIDIALHALYRFAVGISPTSSSRCIWSRYSARAWRM